VTDTLVFEDVFPGQVFPTLKVAISPVQMFYFSAASYNGHRIHYDATWTTQIEGYSGILVQGPFQAALLARAITDWAGPRSRLVEYSVQNREIVYAGETLWFTATVTGKRVLGSLALVDLDACARTDGGAVVMPGKATVSLLRRADLEDLRR
jgi:hydroxyacyl-ACP dehydratase HTD2-like protein with hotdog domain